MTFGLTKGLQVWTMLSIQSNSWMKWGTGGTDSNHGTGYWHPWAIFSAENPPQQQNKGRPLRGALATDKERMAVAGLFQFKAPPATFSVSQWVSKKALQQPVGRFCSNLTSVTRKGKCCLLTIWKKPNVRGRQANTDMRGWPWTVRCTFLGKNPNTHNLINHIVLFQADLCYGKWLHARYCMKPRLTKKPLWTSSLTDREHPRMASW